MSDPKSAKLEQLPKPEVEFDRPSLVFTAIMPPKAYGIEVTCFGPGNIDVIIEKFPRVKGTRSGATQKLRLDLEEAMRNPKSGILKPGLYVLKVLAYNGTRATNSEPWKTSIEISISDIETIMIHPPTLLAQVIIQNPKDAAKKPILRSEINNKIVASRKMIRAELAKRIETTKKRAEKNDASLKASLTNKFAGADKKLGDTLDERASGIEKEMQRQSDAFKATIKEIEQKMVILDTEFKSVKIADVAIADIRKKLGELEAKEEVSEKIALALEKIVEGKDAERDESLKEFLSALVHQNALGLSDLGKTLATAVTEAIKSMPKQPAPPPPQPAGEVPKTASVPSVPKEKLRLLPWLGTLFRFTMKVTAIAAVIVLLAFLGLFAWKSFSTAVKAAPIETHKPVALDGLAPQAPTQPMKIENNITIDIPESSLRATKEADIKTTEDGPQGPLEEILIPIGGEPLACDDQDDQVQYVQQPVQYVQTGPIQRVYYDEPTAYMSAPSVAIGLGFGYGGGYGGSYHHERGYSGDHNRGYRYPDWSRNYAYAGGRGHIPPPPPRPVYRQPPPRQSYSYGNRGQGGQGGHRSR